MYVVVMAGGGGTRLRPLSTAARPKPFLPLLPTGETLLQRTFRRLGGLIDPGDVFVVASPGYAPLIRAQVPNAQVVVEPEARNTAAAIALATAAIERAEDDVMVVLPADHYIADEAVFRGVIENVARGLAGGAFGIERPLVTLGVETTRAATEYGYLVPDLDRSAVIATQHAYVLKAFHEKPAVAEAQRLHDQLGVAWNAGMFVWRRDAIRSALERHAPDVIGAVSRGLASGDLAAPYAEIAPRSIDYAVMEPAAAAGVVVMASMNVGWTDVGSWPALLEVLGAPGIAGGVIEAGTPVEVGSGDVVVARPAGGLVVTDDEEGTITPDQPIAVLRGAREARPLVEALLDRCAAAEART